MLIQLDLIDGAVNQSKHFLQMSLKKTLKSQILCIRFLKQILVLVSNVCQIKIQQLKGEEYLR